MTDRRLIEDSLPLAEISVQSAREKYIRKGHISTLHLWWARRPLAACRAAVYAALVDAPVDDEERQRHHELLKKIVDWDLLDPSHPDHGLLKVAQANIARSHAARVARRHGSHDGADRPRVLDPFSGGGAIPLEAQRLGCETYANDLNPVAHVIELGSIYTLNVSRKMSFVREAAISCRTSTRPRNLDSRLKSSVGPSGYKGASIPRSACSTRPARKTARFSVTFGCGRCIVRIRPVAS
ncbi:hypothetical protein CKO25_04305 [Thiocapsa imhoffii]|uniref:DUF1156 domain-containing protein n=1 Tax=Thiocapsa imhoffii TaxID=382777 RepID=A0A9X1B8A9_9GAMM|nr:hypothetical protein [Thiocapsa imhoffii]